MNLLELYAALSPAHQVVVNGAVLYALVWWVTRGLARRRARRG